MHLKNNNNNILLNKDVTNYAALFGVSMDTCSALVGKLDAGTMEAVKNAFSQLLGNSEFSLPTP